MPAGFLPPMDDDGLLDFEAEYLLLNATSPPPPKRNKRVPKDMNCLRIVHSIHGNITRTEQLRSLLAYQILINCIDTKVANAEDLLHFLISINVKDKGCDFSKIYIYLVLAENWLFSSPLLEEKPLIREMWVLYLRNYSSQITSADWRYHALKVRNRASYLYKLHFDRPSCGETIVS